MQVLVADEVVTRSTDAARAYVAATRARLEAERARDGERACARRSYRRLEVSITPEALAHTWPRADLGSVLDD